MTARGNPPHTTPIARASAGTQQPAHNGLPCADGGTNKERVIKAQRKEEA